MTWNSANTEATVTASSNLPEGSYAVAVKNGTTDLGTSTIAITQQKIAKINIISTKLAVSGVFAVGVTNTQYGYATYTVLDQYGNDIKSSYLANNLNFQTGVGDVVAKNGVLTITPNTNLIQFANVVITGYDSTTGVSTSATLSTSTALGTLSDISLGALTNADGKVLTATDTTSMFYVTYTATDISGNPTTDFNLVKNGLILTGANKDELSISSSYVTAKVVNDPSDSTKAAIQVQVIAPDTIALDLPVSITAMSYAGKTSTLNVTLKKQAEVDSFTLMAPTYDVAVNETKEIPFVAYDQNGSQITKFSKLDTIVTLSGGLRFEQNVDGTAKLVVDASSVKGPQIVTAMTKTGKISTLTLNIQKVATADTLSIDSSVLISAMQQNASQSVDFGFIGGNGGLSVKDQYGRSVDMVGDAGNYKVVATATGNVSASSFAVGNTPITITAGAPGTGAVKFDLIDITDPTRVLDTKTVTMSVVQITDIKGYAIETVGALYTASDVGAVAASGRASDYYANPYVFGTTASGANVVLAGSPVRGVTTTSGSFFATQVGAYDSVKVYADKFADPAKTAGSATLTATVNGVDGKTYTVTTPLTSTTAAPVASTVAASVDTSVQGISVDGDTVTVDLAANSSALVSNSYITRWKNDDGTAQTRAKVYLYAKDQYGTKAMKLASISKIGGTATAFTVDANGKVTVGAVGDGQYADISAVSTNGMIKTIRIVFKTNAPVAAANAAIGSVAQAQADYISAAGLATATVYTDVTAAKNALATELTLQAAAASPSYATAAGLTTTLTTRVNALTTATAALPSGSATVANAAITAANAAKAAYLLAGGLAGNTVYSDVSAAVTNLDTPLAVSPVVPGTVNPLVSTLNGKVTTLKNATTALGSASTLATALAAVNNATDAATMRTALENTTLGLVLTDYNKLTSINKTQVAQTVLAGMPGAGFANPGDVQTALSTKVNTLLGLTVITPATIATLDVPAKAGTPDTTITAGTGYTATVTWSPVATAFAAATVYTATITITPATGYTLVGTASDSWTVTGAATDTNAANSGVITAVFAATAS